MENFVRARKGSTSRDYELRIRSRSGDFLIGSFRVAPQVQDGMVVGILGIARDVTERKRIEEALKTSEARFRAFVDNGPALAFIKDENGRYLYANKSWERCFKRGKADWYGKTDEDLWSAEVACACHQSDQQAWETGKPIETEEKASDEDGRLQVRWVLRFPLEDVGGKRCLGGIAIDITERKHRKPRCGPARSDWIWRCAARLMGCGMVDRCPTSLGILREPRSGTRRDSKPCSGSMRQSFPTCCRAGCC
ncbi:MAG: hypothetical protein C4294_02785, partial [Nitrospiraceae bacterium]